MKLASSCSGGGWYRGNFGENLGEVSNSKEGVYLRDTSQSLYRLRTPPINAWQRHRPILEPLTGLDGVGVTQILRGADATPAMLSNEQKGRNVTGGDNASFSMALMRHKIPRGYPFVVLCES